MKKLPVTAAKNVAEAYGLKQVILMAWDGELTHVVTWGQTQDDCAMAAEGGNYLKEKMGWPTFDDQPPRGSRSWRGCLRRKLRDRLSAPPARAGPCSALQLLAGPL
jgi:hypothetical protein